MSLFSAIQLFGWQKKLGNNWNSDADQQYHRMIVSLCISSLVLGFITIGFDICISQGHLLIEILRELGKRDWIFLLYFAGSFSLIFNNEICPSESAQTFVKNLFQVTRYSI